MSWIVLVLSGVLEAVWATALGIGAVLTVLYAMSSGVGTVSGLKIVFLAMIVGGVVGLKLAH
jgi:quaternary ammonium compound-resistance protein SugE